MSAEVVLASNVAQIEALDPNAREAAITRVLSEARSWLAVAVESSGPTEISEFKKVMATVEEATRQMGLSKEIQLDATEMVRRSERALGQSIRKGQEVGTIRSLSDAHRPGVDYRLVDNRPVNGPTDFASQNELSGGGAGPGIYDLTDEIADEDFEVAVEIAKGEKNLSRANLHRTIKGTSLPKTDRPEYLRGTRRFDLQKAVGSVAADLDNLSFALKFIRDEKPDYSSLSSEDREEWANTMRKAIRDINHFIREITS